MPYYIERWQNYEIDDIYDFKCIETIMYNKYIVPIILFNLFNIFQNHTSFNKNRLPIFECGFDPFEMFMAAARRGVVSIWRRIFD